MKRAIALAEEMGFDSKNNKDTLTGTPKNLAGAAVFGVGAAGAGLRSYLIYWVESLREKYGEAVEKSVLAKSIKKLKVPKWIKKFLLGAIKTLPPAIVQIANIRGLLNDIFTMGSGIDIMAKDSVPVPKDY